MTSLRNAVPPSLECKIVIFLSSVYRTGQYPALIHVQYQQVSHRNAGWIKAKDQIWLVVVVHWRLTKKAQATVRVAISRHVARPCILPLRGSLNRLVVFFVRRQGEINDCRRWTLSTCRTQTSWRRVAPCSRRRSVKARTWGFGYLDSWPTNHGHFRHLEIVVIVVERRRSCRWSSILLM